MERIEMLIKDVGVHQFGVVSPEDAVFSIEVRKMCEANRCNLYGKSWSCPPAVGTFEECEARLKAFRHMLVFSAKYDLEDSFDFEGMENGMKEFKSVARRVEDAVRGKIGEYLMLANEGCGYCESCTYPDAPCRFPDRAHGSIEAYGIFVNELAKSAGINYINGQNTVTYFGALLYNGDMI